MKKPTFIIGKKQIILSCLTLMLGIAVYVNYALTENDIKVKTADVSAGLSVDNKISDNSDAESGKDTSTAASEAKDAAAENEKYGESTFVNGEDTEDYFAQVRLEKMTNRDEAVQTLQTIMGGGDITNDEAVTTALDAVELSRLIESEGNIEALIKAQGFEDCVVYLDGESAKIVVKSDGLDKAQAAAIKDVILSEISIPAENIRIFEV